MTENNSLPSKEFFQKILKVIHANKKSNAIVVDVESKAVVPVGDSFTSNIKRIFIKYKYPEDTKWQMVPVILKRQIRGSLAEDITIGLDFFKTEIAMFNEILPKLEVFLNGSATLSGKFYYTSDEPDFILVLEDLQPLGYEMQNRKIGLDYEHTKGLLKTLSQLHASSVVLAHNHKDHKLENFTKGLYHDHEGSRQWMADGLKSLIKACKALKECKHIGEKLEALGSTEGVLRAFKAAQRDAGGFTVLNHGDTWTNNMLFLHDNNGKLVHTKLIDFQLVKFSSPALDLHYFHATSLIKPLWDKWDEILDYYYSELISNFVLLGHSLKNVPCRKEFQRDFEQRAYYGVIALATVTPFVRSPPHKDADFEHLCKTDDGPDSYREIIYHSQAYLESVKQLMPYFDSLGVLD